MGEDNQAMNWQDATDHLVELQKKLEKIAGYRAEPKLTMIAKLWERFESGEKTKGLYDAMIGFE